MDPWLLGCRFINLLHSLGAVIVSIYGDLREQIFIAMRPPVSDFFNEILGHLWDH